MPSPAQEKKVQISFTNWVLGGSLLVITDENGRQHSRRRRVMMVTGDVEADKSDNSSTISKDKGKEKEKDETVKSSDAKKKDEQKVNKKDKKGDKKDNTANSKFTKAQEEQIKSMKADSKSWNEIAIAVESTKNEVRDRFKELTKPAFEDDGEKKDENNDLKEGGADAIAGCGSWTAEQDEKIKSMKADNKSWKDIAQEIGASKGDVQSRFKEINKVSEPNQATESTNGVVNDGSGDTGGGVVNDLGIDFGGLFTDDNWGNSAGSGWKGNSPTQDEAKKADGGTGKGKKNKQKGKEQARKDKTGGEVSQSVHDLDDFYNEAQGHQGSGRLKVNDIWSREDVEILETLESRYAEHKWLHLQADFYNYTGRMIHAEIIEQKFRDDGTI